MQRDGDVRIVESLDDLHAFASRQFPAEQTLGAKQPFEIAREVGLEGSASSWTLRP